MTRSNPFPGVSSQKRKKLTPEQTAAQKAYFEEIDARGRLYVSAEEIAAMQRGLGRVDLCFGPSGTWLRPYSPHFPAMFWFLLDYRGTMAKQDARS